VKVPPPPPEPVVILDGFVLLEACRVEDPEEADKAVLEGCGISTVVCEDLTFFRKLTHLDLGDNHVQLCDLANLPILKELHLDCNGITQIQIPPDGFSFLEVLNLSYNGLSPEGVLALADLPRLRQLDISRNELLALPENMAGFRTLQVLNCDNNSLTSESCLLSLCLLPSLTHLSLSKNFLTHLPERAGDGFVLLESLNLTHNRIAKEESLLPLVHFSRLHTVLLYGNPFLMHGGASTDLTEVMAQRQIDMATIAPPPPQPPGKVDLRQMRTVAEAPSRRKVQLQYSKTLPKLKGAVEPPANAAKDEGAGSSFFLTSTDATLEGNVELQEAQAKVLEHEDVRADDLLAAGNLDIRSAVNALKHALERPSVQPTSINAHHLKLTANIIHRKRDKFDSGSGSRSQQKLVAGARKTGVLVDDMGTNLTELQQRAIELQPHINAKSGDADGDACMSAMLGILGAMHDVNLGSVSAPPAQPNVA